MRGLTPLLRRLAIVISTAAILLFFSEFYFLNEGPVETVVDVLAESPEEIVLTFAEFTLFYALFTYIFLIVLTRYNVRTVMGIFLAGCIFGWATEGVIIPIVYEAIPFSFIFPSVSWHALVDVLLGWYVIRVLTRRNNPLLSAGMFIALGLAWGAWATWFWGESDFLAPLTPETFTSYVIVTSLLWIVGMMVLDYLDETTFAPSRREVWIVMALTVGFGALMAVPTLPFSLLLLPLIWWTVAALRRQPERTEPHVLSSLRTPPRWWNYPLALLTPLSAALLYPAFYDAGTGIPTEDVTFLLLTAGTVMLLVGLVRPFMRRGASA